MTSARVNQARVDMRNLAAAIDAYRIQHGGNPPDDLSLLTENRPAYISQIKRDPWGQEYDYEPLDLGTYCIQSSGPDGELDTNDDIVHPQ